MGRAYNQIDAPFGQLAQGILKISMYAITSTSAGDEVYANLEGKIASWTAERDGIVAQIKAILEDAECGRVPIGEKTVKQLVDQSLDLIHMADERVANLANCAK